VSRRPGAKLFCRPWQEEWRSHHRLNGKSTASLPPRNTGELTLARLAVIFRRTGGGEVCGLGSPRYSGVEDTGCHHAGILLRLESIG